MASSKPRVARKTAGRRSGFTYKELIAAVVAASVLKELEAQRRLDEGNEYSQRAHDFFIKEAREFKELAHRISDAWWAAKRRSKMRHVDVDFVV